MSEMIDVHDLPEEQVNLLQEFVEFLREKLGVKKLEKEEIKEATQIPIHTVKA